MLIKPLYEYSFDELVQLSADMVIEFNLTGIDTVKRKTDQGEEKINKIIMLYYIQQSFIGQLHEKQQKIKQLNIKIAEQGRELSQFKRQV